MPQSVEIGTLFSGILQFWLLWSVPLHSWQSLFIGLEACEFLRSCLCQGWSASEFRGGPFLQHNSPLPDSKGMEEYGGSFGIWSLQPLSGTSLFSNFPLAWTKHGLVLLSLPPKCTSGWGKSVTVNDYNVFLRGKNTDMRYLSYCNLHWIASAILILTLAFT